MTPLMPQPEQRKSMNPKDAECLGHYLYGSGYFAREDQQMAIVQGARTEASFCNDTCPMKTRERCELMHRERTKERLPDEVEKFERQCEQGAARGLSPLMIAAMRMKRADPEPYMKMALENYRRGASDRRRERGSAIVGRGRPSS